VHFAQGKTAQYTYAAPGRPVNYDRQVSLAALETLTVCLNTAPHVTEPLLEKVMPLLFKQLCGPKQAVRSAAEVALQGMLADCSVWFAIYGKSQNTSVTATTACTMHALQM
jgi:hypothetical protein